MIRSDVMNEWERFEQYHTLVVAGWMGSLVVAGWTGSLVVAGWTGSWWAGEGPVELEDGVLGGSGWDRGASGGVLGGSWMNGILGGS